MFAVSIAMKKDTIFQTCGAYKAAMEATAARPTCQFCYNVGHAVPACVYFKAVMENAPKNAQASQLKL